MREVEAKAREKAFREEITAWLDKISKLPPDQEPPALRRNPVLPANGRPGTSDGTPTNLSQSLQSRYSEEMYAMLLQSLRDKDEVIRSLNEQIQTERAKYREKLQQRTKLLQHTKSQLMDAQYDLALAREQVRRCESQILMKGVDVSAEATGDEDHIGPRPAGTNPRSPLVQRLSSSGTPSSPVPGDSTPDRETTSNSKNKEEERAELNDTLVEINYERKGFWRHVFKNVRTLRRLTLFNNAFEMHDFVYSKGIADLDNLFVCMMDGRIRPDEFAKSCNGQPPSTRQLWLHEVGLQLRSAGMLLKFFDTVYNMSLHCGSSNKQQVVEYINSVICDVMRSVGSKVFLLEGDSMVLLGTRDEREEAKHPEMEGEKRFHGLDGLVGLAARTAETILINQDPHRHTQYKSELDSSMDQPPRSIMCCPVHNYEGKRVLGVITAYDKNGGFSSVDRMLLIAVAKAVGLVLANINMYQAAFSIKHIARIRFMLDNTEEIATREELLPVLSGFVRRATGMLGCERYGLFLRMPPKPGTSGAGDFWAMTEQGQEIIVPMNRSSVIGYSGVTNRPTVVQDVENDHRFSRRVDKSTGFTTRNILCVPVHNRAGQVIGALQMLNKGYDEPSLWNEADIDMLKTFAEYCGIMLERSKYFSTLGSFTLHKWEAVDNLLQRAEIVLDVDAVKLFIIDIFSKTMEPRGYNVSYTSRHGKPQVFPLARDSGIAGHVAITGDIVKVGSFGAACDDPRYKFDVDRAIGRPCMSLLSYPTFDTKNRVAAVIHAINKRSTKSFTWEDETYMEIIARRLEAILIMGT